MEFKDRKAAPGMKESLMPSLPQLLLFSAQRIGLLSDFPSYMIDGYMISSRAEGLYYNLKAGCLAISRSARIERTHHSDFSEEVVTDPYRDHRQDQASDCIAIVQRSD